MNDSSNKFLPLLKMISIKESHCFHLSKNEVVRFFFDEKSLAFLINLCNTIVTNVSVYPGGLYAIYN